MALFRAFAEPRNTLKLEAAERKLAAVLTWESEIAKLAETLPLRQGAIRKAVIEVLMRADEAPAPIEVRRRAASRVGRSVKQHTVTATLGLLGRVSELL